MFNHSYLYEWQRLKNEQAEVRKIEGSKYRKNLRGPITIHCRPTKPMELEEDGECVMRKGSM